METQEKETKSIRRKKSERNFRPTRQRERREEGGVNYTKARLKSLRSAPRKVRLLADQIRGKSVQDALQILDFSPRGAAEAVYKLVKSAMHNAENEGLNVDTLRVSEIWVDGGPILKRFMPRAMGRASRINKRTSHVTVILKEEE